jgi:hypothetical protein
MVLGLICFVASTLCEATTKRIQVIAQVTQQTFIGEPASPQLGDRRITNVDLLDESGIRVGTGGSSCTIVSVPPLDILEQCLLTAVFVDGQIMFGGLAPSAEVGASAQFGILGGTDAFRNARGDVMAVVTAPDTIEVTIELD